MPTPPLHQLLLRRSFGTRGARGHGWYQNYRAGKGGRHLQGEYFDRPTDCLDWNAKILQLGSTRAYLDISVESRNEEATQLEEHRLYMNLASAVLPESTAHFLSLAPGGSLHRKEANVGWLSSHESIARTPIHNDPWVLWHQPGTISLVVQHVAHVDDRWLLATHAAPHLDGIHRAIGQLESESLERVLEWSRSLLTFQGRPTNVQLTIRGVGEA